MGKYNVSAVTIENGIINSEFFCTTETQKEFLSDKTVIEVFPVVGWKFDKVHLTHGNQENGEGWGFHK